MAREITRESLLEVLSDAVPPGQQVRNVALVDHTNNLGQKLAVAMALTDTHLVSRALKPKLLGGGWKGHTPFVAARPVPCRILTEKPFSFELTVTNAFGGTLRQIMVHSLGETRQIAQRLAQDH